MRVEAPLQAQQRHGPLSRLQEKTHMRMPRSLKLTASGALTSVVATLALAGPLAGSALAAPKPRAPLPTVTATVSAADSTPLGGRTASPTAHFSWAAISGETYSCFLDGGSKTACTTTADYSGIGSGTHTFTLKVAKLAGKRPNTYVFTWAVDRTPPTSPPAVDPLPTPTSNTSANVTFTKVDPSTASFKCALDDSVPANAQTCSSPWPVAGLSETTHTAYVYAVDDLGNMNTTAGHVTWVVDHTAPSSPTVSVTPVGPTNLSTATITWVDGDAVSFTCVLDNAAPVDCTSFDVSGWNLTNLSEGTHVVAVTGTDGAGNVGLPGKVHWIVDQTPPPAPTISTGPSTTTDNTSATFQFGDADSSATFECKLDAGSTLGSYAPCTSPTTYAGPLADGGYTFSVRATDAAGNQGGASTWSWTIDTVTASITAPQIITGPTVLTNDVTPTFEFVSLDDPTATFVCAVDPADPTNQASYSACTSGGSIPVGTDGDHTLYVEEISGGVNSLPSTWNWTLDSTPPPAPTFSAKPDTFSNATSAMFNFSDTEANVSYVCQLDALTPFACTAPANVTQLGEGSHTFTVTATDAAGNTAAGSVASYGWTVDLTAPGKPSVTGADPSGSTQTLTVTTVDSDVTGYLCTLDTATAASCDNSPSFSNLSSGEHTILVQAVDHAGNVGLPQPFTWTVDPGSPNAPSFSHTPATLTNSKSADFSFSDDSTPGIPQSAVTAFNCWLDGVLQPCDSTDFSGVPNGSMSLTNLSEGTHTFKVAGINALQNGTASTYVWTVDLTKPNVSVAGLPSTGSLVNTTSIAPTVSDDDANTSTTYTCSLTGPGGFSSTSCAGAANLVDGTYTFTADTTDLAGNAATPFSRTWSVDATAPAAAVTTPTTLTGAAVASWSEAVSGLNTSKVTLKETDSGKVIPATVSCLSAEVATSCGSTIDMLKVTPTGRLVPGQHYTVTVASGAAHDAATNTSTVASSNFRAQRTLQENTLPVAVAWSKVKARTAFGRSYLSEHLAGAQATYAFRGKSITWWTVTGPTQGKATVYVDGHRKATVNNYKAATSYRVARTFKRLGAGRHVLTVRVLGAKGAKRATGTSVGIDAFTVGKTRASSPKVGMSWHRLSGAGYFARHAVSADLAGAAISVTFRGTSIAWTTVRNRTQGKAAVYVDGARKMIVDNYSTRSLSKVRRLVRGLSDSVHTLRIVVTGKHHKGGKGNTVTVDRFVIG